MDKLIIKLDGQAYFEKIPLEIQQNIETLPSISIVTLTHNRHKFFNLAIMNYKGTDYPEHLLEWIIVDDGTDKIEDLINASPLKQYIKYVKLGERITLGKKRNLMHEHT